MGLRTHALAFGSRLTGTAGRTGGWNDQCAFSSALIAGSEYSAGSAAGNDGTSAIPKSRSIAARQVMVLPTYPERPGVGNRSLPSTAAGSAKIAGTPPVWMKTITEPGAYFFARTSAIRPAIALAE